VYQLRLDKRGEAVSPVSEPTPATLKKYGLTSAEWRAILDRQGGGCGACGTVPPSGRLNVDHAHVRGWKKMVPEERKGYVRGLLCYMCNTHTLSRGATVAKLEGAAKYLRDYERRRAE
jgi:hypothetical protein